MRTTLTLDDDIAAKLQELARRRRVSFKDVVNAVLRNGLTSPRQRSKVEQPYQTPTFRSSFRPGVDPLRLNHLTDELEIADFAAPSR